MGKECKVKLVGQFETSVVQLSTCRSHCFQRKKLYGSASNFFRTDHMPGIRTYILELLDEDNNLDINWHVNTHASDNIVLMGTEASEVISFITPDVLYKYI